MKAFLAVTALVPVSLPGVFRFLGLSRRPSARPLIVASGSMEGSGPGATQVPPHVLPPVVRVVEEIRPPNAPPVVTPLMAKAGSVRRTELGPPCHGCACCRTYGRRLHDAHAEIDRLRGELEAADARRINTPRPLHVARDVAFTGGQS